MNKDISYWRNLSERYFEAQTTEDEEARLKSFLASNASSDPCFDEIKVVMGYLAFKKKKDKVVRLRYSNVAVGAAAAVALLIGLFTFTNEHICATWVYGSKVTDTKIVMSSVEQTLSEVLSSGTSIEDELDFLIGE